MAKKKRKVVKTSVEDVAEIIDVDGLGYAVMHYTDGSDFADYELQAFWEDARIALKNIDTYLKKKVPTYEPEW